MVQSHWGGEAQFHTKSRIGPNSQDVRSVRRVNGENGSCRCTKTVVDGRVGGSGRLADKADGRGRVEGEMQGQLVFKQPWSPEATAGSVYSPHAQGHRHLPRKHLWHPSTQAPNPQAPRQG